MRFFIASVGNPGPLYNTLHSAGHHLLDALHKTLHMPPFSRNLSIGTELALFRSPVLMNASGPPIIKAYRSFLPSLDPTDRNRCRLVILLDELDDPLGKLRLRTEGSLRGHNGLKSISQSLGVKDFARISVGIARPKGVKDPQDVSNFVLRRMTDKEKTVFAEKGEEVIALLETLPEQG